MPKHPSEEQLAFHYAVYAKVCEIPYGHVTSYGRIAKLIDCPERPRQVGMSLKYKDKYLPYLTDDEQTLLFKEEIPWWRVINSQGIISKRETVQAEKRQVERLRSENVDVEERDWTAASTPPSSWTKYHVDFAKYGWFPEEQ